MGQCPSSFILVGNGCAKQCPVDKGFENKIVGGQPRCVYAADPTQAVDLNIIGVSSYADWTKPAPPPVSIESLKTTNPAKHTAYSAENTRVNEKIAILLANMDKKKKINDAFVKLQEAENGRDKAPIAYSLARTNYYTLVKGDTWREEERQRVAKAEVDPEIQRMKANLENIQHRQGQQAKTIDVVKGLKDKVLSLKDDFKYSVDTFERQTGKLKDQILYDRRKRVEDDTTPKWELLDRVLNYTIVAILLFAIWKIYKLFFSTGATPANATAELGLARLNT